MIVLLTEGIGKGRKLGPDFVVVPNTVAALERLPGAQAAIVQVDEALTDPLSHLPSEVVGKLLLIGDLSGPPGLLNLAGHAAVGTLNARHFPPSDDELRQAVVRMLERSVDPLTGILRPGTEIASAQLNDSTRRGHVIDLIEQFFSTKVSDSRLINQLLTIADELVTNAFYHAPIDPSGRRPYSRMSRIDPVKCPPDRAITVRYAFDGQRAALAVRDRYGTLERAMLLRSLSLCIGDPRAVSTTSLGLQTAFRAASRMLFHVVVEESTECIGYIDIDGGYRRFVESGKGFDFYFLR